MARAAEASQLDRCRLWQRAFTEVLIARCAPAAVTGIDPSDAQLAYARTRPGAKLAQFRVADAQSLPFPDDSFDAASMALVLVFVHDPLKAVAEMARVVRPGGLVATYMWEFPNGFPHAPIAAAMKSLGMAAPERPNVQASKRDAMRDIWQRAGLTSVETEVIRIRVAFADFADYWESSTVPVGPSGKALAARTPWASKVSGFDFGMFLRTTPFGSAVASPLTVMTTRCLS